MPALDTNLVVRLVVGDDPEQVRLIEQLLSERLCEVSLSVLMESEWVLRSCYGLDAALINQSLRDLLVLTNISCQEPELANQVLAAHAAGVDFADAIHVVQTQLSDDFLTFDRSLVRMARRAALRSVLLLR